MDGFSLVFGSFVVGAVCAAVAAALGASAPFVWVIGVCAFLGFGWAALKYDN